ncbi:MAG: hypothetical protein INR63_17460 [Actinomycetospora chiangmaiensis]|jgi:hypothetical protein|nr:hypothetical protein [Actinomycetospora chiangmaiensis]
MGPDPARSRRPLGVRAAPLRAVIAVLSLYAFVLQAFFGGLMPMSAAADGLCAQHTASDSAPGKTLPQGHGDCCTAVQLGGTALPPRPGFTAITWDARASDRPLYATVDGPSPRGPPDRSASPRGPPSA